MSSSLTLCNNKEPFLDWIVMCDEKWILHDNQWWLAQWLDREETPKHFPKPNLHPQKRLWSLFGGVLPVWSMTAFWILVKPLHLRIMFSKSMRCTKNCNACSWHWSTERAQFFSMTIPNHMLHNQHFKSWMNRAVKFCFTHHIHLTSHQVPLLQATQQLFAGKMLPQPAGGRKCFPRVHWIPKHGFLCCRNKQTYFLLAKIFWL